MFWSQQNVQLVLERVFHLFDLDHISIKMFCTTPHIQNIVIHINNVTSFAQLLKKINVYTDYKLTDVFVCVCVVFKRLAFTQITTMHILQGKNCQLTVNEVGGCLCFNENVDMFTTTTKKQCFQQFQNIQ